ncbi:MAG TPA: hypothetical protein VFJ43_08275 [Bacteroidia bacterium]|nr:hypothetical protein [Bacteroidia bacterium]
MIKYLFILFISFTIPLFSQNNPEKETLAKIFIEIPDTFFSELRHEQDDSIKIDKAMRRSMIDTLNVTDEWNPVIHFTAFDTVNHYLKLLSKRGDPEGMWSEIAYWNRNDGNKLVMMTINYGDMCVEEQTHRYFWIYNGTQFTPVNESDVIPDIESSYCISETFLKKHKKAREAALPYRIAHTANEDNTSFTFSPEFDYLFSCDDSFTDDAWYGLTGDDIIRKEIVLEWNGSKFILKK